MPYAVTKHFDQTHSDNPIETTTFIDGFGKVIQVKKDGFLDGQEVSLVSGRIKYDALERPVENYYPFVETSNKYTYTPNSDAGGFKTITTYDALDRVLTTIFPDNTKVENQYTDSDGLMKITMFDALKNQQDTYVNGDGLTVQTVQHNGNRQILTTFGYDGINRLTSVTDAAGQKTSYVYDMADRRTVVSHPVSGTTIFDYDVAGNLRTKQTANGDIITYDYDYNRLKSITYPRHPENNVTYAYGTASDATYNRKGRLISQEDGSGTQEFKYGNMGEVTEITRKLIIPNQAVASYVTKFQYDSWNRLMNMTYPDGEVVNYYYNTGGLLNKVSSNMNEYISDIHYDKFEQRTYMKYGNGTETFYAYNDSNRTMKELSVKSKGVAIMNNAYRYDPVKNVIGVINTGVPQQANKTIAGTIGGTIEHTYEYDQLYRLKKAHGQFNNGNSKTAQYDLNMAYDDMHNITYKSQLMEQNGVQFNGSLHAGYKLGYNYANNSQQITNIADTSYRYEGAVVAPVITTQQYSYDKNGNLLEVNTGSLSSGNLRATNKRQMLWDEENRLLAINDNGYVSNYWYDAAGERTVKESFDNEGVRVNGRLAADNMGSSRFTAYISPYMVVSNGGNYTKHIYIGSQRITSKVSNSAIFNASPVITNDLTAKYAALTAKIKERFDSLGATYKGTEHTGGLISTRDIDGQGTYFYHSDHLGSSTLITDPTGAVTQHVEYVPYGETFIDERNSSWNTPYKFNAKEQDEETGLYYYGARYYDPKTSVWISVDPLAEKYPNISSYVYCAGNPVNFVDPDGRFLKPSSLFTNSRYGAIYSNLYDNNKTYKSILKSYWDSKTKNVTLNFGDVVSNKNMNAHTTTSMNANVIIDYATRTRKITDYKIESVQDFSASSLGITPNGNVRSDFGLARTIIHEAIHSMIGNIYNLKDDANHNAFSKYIGLVVDGLTEYNNAHQLGYTHEQIVDFSWRGAESSDLFKSYIQNIVDNNKTTYQVEYENWVRRTSKIEYTKPTTATNQ